MTLEKVYDIFANHGYLEEDVLLILDCKFETFNYFDIVDIFYLSSFNLGKFKGVWRDNSYKLLNNIFDTVSKELLARRCLCA